MSDLGHDQQHSSLERLLALKAPSRLASRDATLFAGSAGITGLDDLQSQVAGFLGWVGLSDCSIESITAIVDAAEQVRAEGLQAVVLIGQGGSSQAAMTITKLHEVSTGRTDIAFRTMDSLSPVYVNHILLSSDPDKTLYIVASKSGSTIEPLTLESVVWSFVLDRLGSEATANRFAAITDPGSELEQLAKKRGYRFIFSTPTDVGGRFSAMTAFALLPAALVGIGIAEAMRAAAAIEARCAADDWANPALDLAAFIHGCYLEGRDKVSLVMPPTGQVFGLWIEQLVAESLGKCGIGILPNVEVDASILAVPRDDRCAITFAVGRTDGFAESLANIDASIPVRHCSLNDVDELFGCFIIWEYAIAYLGVLLGVNPFNQPDVEETKRRVRALLRNPGLPQDDSCDCFGVAMPQLDELRHVRVSTALLGDGQTSASFASVDHALRALLGSLNKGDYFCLNAFLPFLGYGRREALERMRHRVASRLGIVSCLEIGPRYLHSTGQLHKGGPNTGVYLFVSADESDDIAVPGQEYSLGELAMTQARGDFESLAAYGRRAVFVHLANNDSQTLSHFADRLCSAISAIKAPR